MFKETRTKDILIMIGIVVIGVFIVIPILIALPFNIQSAKRDKPFMDSFKEVNELYDNRLRISYKGNFDMCYYDVIYDIPENCDPIVLWEIAYELDRHISDEDAFDPLRGGIQITVCSLDEQYRFIVSRGYGRNDLSDSKCRRVTTNIFSRDYSFISQFENVAQIEIDAEAFTDDMCDTVLASFDSCGLPITLIGADDVV